MWIVGEVIDKTSLARDVMAQLWVDGLRASSQRFDEVVLNWKRAGVKTETWIGDDLYVKSVEDGGRHFVDIGKGPAYLRLGAEAIKATVDLSRPHDEEGYVVFPYPRFDQRGRVELTRSFVVKVSTEDYQRILEEAYK